MYKKIIFSLIFFISGFSLVSASDYMLYTNHSQGDKCYRKLASDLTTNNGTAMTTVGCITPSYSKDGQYIYYSNVSDGYKCYKKNANDNSNGTAITSNVCYFPVESFDGTKIYYRNATDGDKIYVKNSNDSSNGSVFINYALSNPEISPDGTKMLVDSLTQYSSFGQIRSISNPGTVLYQSTYNCMDASYSPDGTKIICSNLQSPTSSKLYLMDSNLSSNPNFFLINNSYSRFPVFTPDSNYVVYTYGNVYGVCYYKDIFYGNTSNGYAITTDSCMYPTYSPVPNATCQDQIQNQDETGIDTGGICGNQTCAMQETNMKYISYGYTGSYSTYTNQIYGSSTGAESYLLIQTPPSSYSYYKFEVGSYKAVGMVFTSPLKTFEDLFNGNLSFYVPGSVQSPLDSLNFSKPYLELSSYSYPIDWFWINGSDGTIDGENSSDSIKDGYNCVFLQDGNGNEIKDQTGRTCFPVGTTGFSLTNLIKPNSNGEYILRIMFNHNMLDKNYKITGIGYGHYTDQFMENYVCKNNDTSEYTLNGNPITDDRYAEITGINDEIRESISDNRVKIDDIDLNTYSINNDISIKSLFTSCPAGLKNIDISYFSFMTYNLSVPLTDINLNPFSGMACGLKSIMNTYNYFRSNAFN
ncbi:MAG: hypothetical protein PHS92_02090 [Candidatus Gracilibacteria bacterium]|nr:hypothetical protein [Candidatus Gracilibacteria bacterium]